MPGGPLLEIMPPTLLPPNGREECECVTSARAKKRSAAALNGLIFVGRFYDHDTSHLFSGLLAKLPLRQLLDELYEAGLGGLERSSALRW